MKKLMLVAMVLTLGLLAAPGPAAAHWSVSIGVPFPVVVGPPPCAYRSGYPYPAYYGGYPAPYAYPSPYAFDYYGGPGLHRYGQPRYFSDDDGWRYGNGGWERRPWAHGYTLH